MKKVILGSLCVLGTALTSQAQVLVNEDFSGYSDTTNVNGTSGWVASTNGAAFAVESGELVMAQVEQDNRLMYSTTGANLQYGDAVKITLDFRMSMSSDRKHGGILGLGVQTSNTVAGGESPEVVNAWGINFGLEPQFRYSGQMTFMPNQAEWNQDSFVMLADPDCGFNPFGYYTNSAPYDDPAYIDSDSDIIQMVYTITKSHVTNQFDVALSCSNTVNATYFETSRKGIERADAWQSSDFWVYLASPGTPGYTNRVQSIKMEKVAAYMPPTGVNALGLDGSVSLTWDVMPGATQYKVYRRDPGGSFGAPIATVSDESHEDTTITNGDTYFYAVVATYYNGDSAISEEKEVTPMKVYVGEAIYSDDFSGFAPGDMTQNADWEAVSGSGSNAFAIVGNTADTVSTEADFDTSVGNAVYLDKLIGNAFDDSVKGSFDFKVSSTAEPGMDADFGNSGVMAWGLTASTSESLDVDKAVMALFHVTVRYENGVFILFGQDGNNEDDNTLAGFNWDNAGWNPKPDAAATQSWLGDPAAPQDLETDLFRVDWEIRKTREAGVYQAWASMSNMTQNIATSGTIVFDTKSAADLYDSPASLFTMGHYHLANNGSAFSVLHTTIDSVSLTHTTNNLPDVLAPVVNEVVSIDRGVILDWDPILEATGYSVFMETGGINYTVTNNTQDVSVTDKPRWNGVENTYTVRALYDYPEAPLSPDYLDSVPANGTPQALFTRLIMDGSAQNYSDNWKFDLTQNQQTNGTLAYFDNTVTPWVENGVASSGDPGIGTWTGPTLHALTQVATNGIRNLSTWDEWAWVSPGNSAYHGFNHHFNWGAGLEQLVYAQVDQWSYDEGAPASVDMSASPFTISVGSDWLLLGAPSGSFKLRAAVRSGGQWYVSDAGALHGETGVMRVDVQDTMWATLSTTPGTDMAIGSFTVDHTSLTAVDAAGWFYDAGYRIFIYKLEILESKELPSYDYWAKESGLVSTNNAGADDPDLDGINNSKEYAYGGDPLVADTAILPEMDMTIVSDPVTAEDVFTYVHLEQNDPNSGIIYNLKESTDLVNVPFTSADYTATTNVVDYYWSVVTNYIPVTEQNLFIKLDIE